MRLPAPLSLTYPVLSLVSSTCQRQLSESERQVALWSSRVSQVGGLRKLMGWIVAGSLTLLQFGWWIPLLCAFFHGLLTILYARWEGELAGWEEARRGQTQLPRLAQPLERLGMRDCHIQVSPGRPKLLSRRTSGGQTDSEYRSDWIVIRGHRGDLEVELALRDEVAIWEYQGQCEPSCTCREETHSSSLWARCRAQNPLDRRNSLIRRSFPRRADCADLVALLNEMEGWDVEPRPCSCPGCGLEMGPEGCCGAVWVERRSKHGKNLWPAPDSVVPFGQRTCPGCDSPLEVVRIDRIPVETCSQCMGFWVSRNFQPHPVGWGHERHQSQRATDS